MRGNQSTKPGNEGLIQRRQISGTDIQICNSTESPAPPPGFICAVNPWVRVSPLIPLHSNGWMRPPWTQTLIKPTGSETASSSHYLWSSAPRRLPLTICLRSPALRRATSLESQPEVSLGSGLGRDSGPYCFLPQTIETTKEEAAELWRLTPYFCKGPFDLLGSHLTVTIPNQ